jgi:site-specific DNA-methyltransferase (adenine-specific)
MIDLRNGDCIEQMRQLPANSVDSIVTDPPYELGFMGKSWDSTGIAYSVKMWDEALRVLKPGGHLLAFSGSRTYHRMAVAIEDAGFEIRDQIMWVYGSGFPKSLDVSKAIDKQAGVERERVNYTGGIASGKNNYGGNGSVHVGTKVGNEAITDKAKQWAGWGTALKPAHEPIVLARKPLIGTVATNVIIHGTGALNIDGSRVGNYGGTFKASKPEGTSNGIYGEGINGTVDIGKLNAGRWPANFIHDGSDEVVELFPDTGKSTGGRIGKKSMGEVTNVPAGQYEAGDPGYGDSGSAARFFYCAKASKKDRNEGLDDFVGKEVGTKGNGLARTCATCGASTLQGCECADRTYVNPTRANHHPTVKPTELMRYLVRLVTPPNGTVLDPFMGSGSTGKAAVLERFSFIGIDQSADYLEIATARIKHAQDQVEGMLL